MGENVTAIIPAYNEAENILDTIESIKKIKYIKEIIVVDDGSSDNTYKIISVLEDIILLQYNKNRGKGFAIKSALPYVSSKYVLLVDADLKQSALELGKLVNNARLNSKTMLVAVYPKPLKKGGFGLVKSLSQKGLYLLTSKKLDSILSGQRVMSTDFIKSIIIPNNFGMEFKITLEAIRNNIEIIEVPVNIRHRETGRNLRGFIHRGKQFFNILNVMIREMM